MAYLLSLVVILLASCPCGSAWLVVAPVSQSQHVRQTMQVKDLHPTFCRGESLSAALSGSAEDFMSSSVPIALIAALGLGFAAQTWINGMLQGDRGLGAFLKDGRGFNQSGFRPRNSNSPFDGTDAPLSGPDPLPWLSLPKLDFVDVAGQSNDDTRNLESELEEIRLEMIEMQQQGKLDDANVLRQKLERLMQENGFEFKSDAFR